MAGGWVAHVGSSNERPGMTGIAHLFEHMMFKGTRTIGTKNYERDQQIIQEQERIRDQIRQEEAKMRAAYRRGDIDDVTKPENKTERLKELEAQRLGCKSPEQITNQVRENWWAERGSRRFINDQQGLEAAIRYVRDGQG